jgi:methyl-accepting chemotaxis protein
MGKKRRLKIMTKLIVAFGIAELAIVALCFLGKLTLEGNIKTGSDLRERNFELTRVLDKIDVLGRYIINRIDSSASDATDDGLILARQKKDALLAHVKEAQGLSDNEDFTEKLNHLVKVFDELYATGINRVELIINQDFAQIPEATEAFQNKARSFTALSSAVKEWSKEDLERAFDEMAAMARRGANSILFICCLVIPIPALLFFLVHRSVSPMKHLKKVMSELSSGNLKVRSDIQSQDEMGHLCASVDLFIDGLRQDMCHTAESAAVLDESSSKLSATASQTFSSTINVAMRSDAVASNAEEMSTNMNSIAVAMEQTSSNVSMVASAAEEMSVAISEISKNTETASNITNEVVSQAGVASQRLNELRGAAEQIGKVTEAINEISEQTHLLALNATIEAARAGEAGKGFAVVANEIKALARQTAEATEEIKSTVHAVQSSTDNTSGDIEQISKVIEDVNEIVCLTAAALEQQSVTTRDIASSVAEASAGIQDVSARVAQSSNLAEEVAQEISEMHKATKDISNGGSQLNASAELLSRLAEELKTMVSRFKV